MAWTTPVTWAIGQLVTASDMNAQVRDNLNHLKVLVDNDGKIPALSSTYLGNLDGTNLTGLARLASLNTYSGVNNFNSGSGRVVLPVGVDKWAT